MTALTEPSAGSVASSLRSARAGWRVPAYLVTKAIASGTFMVMAIFELLGPSGVSRQMALFGNGVALFFLAITTVLLVGDLERPERFLRILTRPQWKSWLTRGAFVLVAFSALCATWFAIELGALRYWWPEEVAESVRLPLAVIGLPLALLTAIYTAFLFQQCEGRDLWQRQDMAWNMGVRALMAGAAMWLALDAYDLTLDHFYPQSRYLDEWGWRDWLVEGWQYVWIWFILLWTVVRDGVQRWIELRRVMDTANTNQALVRLGRGWALVTVYGQLIPLFLFLLGASIDSSVICLVSYLASPLMILIGLFLYESAIIKAGQDVPNT